MFIVLLMYFEDAVTYRLDTRHYDFSIYISLCNIYHDLGKLTVNHIAKSHKLMS